MFENVLILNTVGGVGALMALVMLWTVPWKGVALWKAARADSKGWFVVFLFVNTLAILEILYIFVFSKEKKGKKINGTDKRPENNITDKQRVAE